MYHTYSFITDEYLILPLQASEIEKLRLLRNRAEIRKRFLYSDEISSEQQNQWFNNYLRKKNDIMFSVFMNDISRQWIGSAALYNIDKEKGTAEFGRIVIDKESAPQKGVGTSVTKAVCKIGFDQLELNAIYLEVFSDNAGAIKTYLNSGFSITGHRMHHDQELTLMKNTKNIL